MTYSEASLIVQKYTGKPLLESLEHIKNADHPVNPKVRVAYHTLMAGFIELIG